MNEELIKIFNTVCVEYQHIHEKFKILITFETLVIAIAFNYVVNNVESFNNIEKIFFYFIILASFLILVLLVTPDTKYVLGNKYRKIRKKSGNIFDVYDIDTYDNIEYLEVLQREQVISVKTENFSQSDLSQSASIIHKAHSVVVI